MAQRPSGPGSLKRGDLSDDESPEISPVGPRDGQHRDQELPPAAPRTKPPLPDFPVPVTGGKMPQHKALVHHWNLFAIIFLVFNLLATALYFKIRVERLINGEYTVFWYSLLILIIEGFGVTSLVPYGLLITRSWLPNPDRKPMTGGPLPTTGPPVYNFHVRVCVPCYKEDLSVIEATVNAALNAELPAGTKRTVYLCDDGKCPIKRDWCNRHAKAHEIVYVTGRKRADFEINGKSANINNCLQNVVFAHLKDPSKKAEEGHNPINFQAIANEEILVVFDADMVCKPCFFTDILAVMTDPQMALCLSPQSFSNIEHYKDLFNNINLQFWEYWLPGASAWGYIACTGTNFAMRIRPLCHAGWFPTYTITEDYALGYELKKLGYKGSYLKKYIAEGEAPDEIRNVFRQRSRWTKGHMQVFFSWKYCPLLQWKLGLDQKLWYSYGTWSYFCTILTVPTFIIVPFVSLALGVHPVMIDMQMAVVASAYFLSCMLIQSYTRAIQHWTSLWFVSISNVVLWFTYVKAVANTLLSVIGLKLLGFKVTKKKEPAAAPKPSFISNIIKAVSTRFSRREKPVGFGSADIAAAEKASLLGGGPQSHQQAPVIVAMPEDEKPKRGVVSRAINIFIPHNVGDLDGTLDAAVLVLLFIFAVLSLAMGIFRVVTSNSSSPDGENAFMNAWVALPILWAILNGIAPYLFIHYCFSGGDSFETACKICRVLTNLLTVCALVLVFFTIPKDFDVVGGFTSSVDFISSQRASRLGINDVAEVKGLAPFETQGQGWYVSGNGDRPIMPTAFATTYLAWGLLEYARGYGHRADEVYDNVKTGADYIVASFINPNPSDFKFVVQVGDPKRYAVEGEPNRIGSNRVWTTIKNDHSLTNGQNRPAYILDNTHVGADALGSATAALAAAATLAKARGDTAAADKYLATARPLFNFATKSPAGEEKSYCKVLEKEGICEFDLKFSRNVLVEKVSETAVPNEEKIRCWVPDFSERTCMPKVEQQQCLEARKYGHVYKRRADCCAEMTNAGMYKNQTTAQGACALPDKQYTCSIPDLLTLTCKQDEIKLPSGKGCTGVGMSIFPNDAACCNYLVAYGKITADNPGTGVCMPDADRFLEGAKSCYVPAQFQSTCVEIKDLKKCQKYGVGRAFTDTLQCCNKLVSLGATAPYTGVCKKTAIKGDKCFQLSSASRGCVELSNTEGKDGEPSACDTAALDGKVYATKDACCNEVLAFVNPKDAKGVCAVAADPPAEDKVKDDAEEKPPPAGGDGGARRLLSSLLSYSRHLLQDNLLPDPAAAAAAAAAPKLDQPTDGKAAKFKATNEQAAASSTAPQVMPVEDDIRVEHYNSKSVLDDLALAGVWMYKATGEAVYLGRAQEYMADHVRNEAGKGLAADPTYYVPNWDNSVWAAAVLLAEITDQPQYHDVARTFLRAWQGGKAPPVSTQQKALAELVAGMRKKEAEAKLMQMDRIVVDPVDPKIEYKVVEAACVPERNTTIDESTLPPIMNSSLIVDMRYKQWEDTCDDGIDNDCDGLIDDEDPDCPFMPVKYTPRSLAWTEHEPLPNAAAAAFLSMIYQKVATPQERLTTQQQVNLKCWALGQAQYMLGKGGRSYVVGIGKKYPKRIQHMDSSCPTDDGCDWNSGFYAGVPNPRLELVSGALVAGPDLRDKFADDRASPDTRVGVHYNAPFTGMLAALLQEEMRTRTCGQLRGVYQDLFMKGEL